MKHPDPRLHTPIYVKSDPDMVWPQDERVFYLLASEGLYLCRNHRFFSSCVPAPGFPCELATQRKFLRIRFPKIPRRLLEQIVGFFARIGAEHGAEAAVLLAWDDPAACVRAVVPQQTATVSSSWSGKPFPMDVHYQMPKLAEGLTFLGDIHSHVDMSAYASWTDKRDEIHSAGLHIVVGRIQQEPPEFHIEATVDGVRFRVDDPALVFAGYRRRCLDVPQPWFDKVQVVPWNKQVPAAPNDSSGTLQAEHQDASTR